MSRWFKRRPDLAGHDSGAAKLAKLRHDRVQRQQLLIEHETFVAQLEALLFEQDPLGIDHDDNTDEYRQEAETITIRLFEAADEDDAQRIVHEEFVSWSHPHLAGPPERYAEIAKTTWQNWLSFTTGAV